MCRLLEDSLHFYLVTLIENLEEQKGFEDPAVKKLLTKISGRLGKLLDMDGPFNWVENSEANSDSIADDVADALAELQNQVYQPPYSGWSVDELTKIEKALRVPEHFEDIHIGSSDKGQLNIRYTKNGTEHNVPLEFDYNGDYFADIRLSDPPQNLSTMPHPYGDNLKEVFYEPTAKVVITGDASPSLEVEFKGGVRIYQQDKEGCVILAKDGSW